MQASVAWAMFLAAGKGDAQAMAAWLDESGGVDARCAEQDRATLLMAAAYRGHQLLLLKLLESMPSTEHERFLGTKLYSLVQVHTTRIY